MWFFFVALYSVSFKSYLEISSIFHTLTLLLLQVKHPLLDFL